MLTIQVAELEALKKNLLPFLHISSYADFRFSRSTASFTAGCSLNTSCIFVQLEISEPFFALVSSNSTSPADFHSNIKIDDFFLSTNLIGTHDRFLTLLVPDDHSYTHLIFTTPVGHLQHFSALAMGPPQNMKVAPIGGGAFIAIDADWFRDITSRLCAFNTRIWVTATVSHVIFSARVMEFVLPTEDKRCRIGGTISGNGFRFQVTLIPHQFYVQASYLDKLVHFHRSTDGRTVVSFETGNWTNIVAYNTEDLWEVL